MKESNKCMHMLCYKNKLLNGVSGCYDKNIDVMTKETNENYYGGGCTRLNYYSLSEMQLTYQDVVIDGNITKEVTEVKFPLKSVEFSKENNNYKILGSFNANIEGSSFVFNNSLSECLPEIMQFLKCYMFIDSNKKCIKFDSLVYSFVPK